jgi:peptide/nickel transport system permease protein
VALGVAPAGAVALLSTGVALLSERSPTRLVLERAWAPPSLALPLGASEGGIDVLAALSHGTARGLALALVVVLVGFLVGTPLGAAAGMAGGARATALARACDLVQSFPSFLLALAVLAAVRSPGRLHIGLVFCVTSWAPFARLALLQATVLRGASFVEAARALGASRPRVLLGHVLPNLLGPVAVQGGSAAAAVVLGEAALGFLGLGPRDGVSLGALLEQGTAGMLRAPHVLAASALAVAGVSGSLQLASESLRRWVGGPVDPLE